MSAILSVSTDKLAHLIGMPGRPILIDVRTGADFAADPKLNPISIRRSHQDVAQGASIYSGQFVVPSCACGKKISLGLSALLGFVGGDVNRFLTERQA
jgi:hypothetical protein